MDQETQILDRETGSSEEGLVFPALDFDKPNTWASAEIYVSPDFDAEKFQAKLDELFGLSETGFPIVRLVWAGDIKKTYSKFYCAWDNAGFGIKSELRAKYCYASIAIPGTPDTIDIPPPRWILEQFNHPGQYMATWLQTRFSKDGREIRPGPPPWGYYSHLWTVAEHDKECCAEAIERKKVCWGKYRKPDDVDIEILAKAKQKRDAEPEIDTTKPLDEKAIEAINRDTEARIAMVDAIVEEHLRDFVEENAIELIEEFTGQRVSDTARKMFSIPAELKGKHKLNVETGAREIVPFK